MTSHQHRLFPRGVPEPVREAAKTQSYQEAASNIQVWLQALVASLKAEAPGE